MQVMIDVDGGPGGPTTVDLEPFPLPARPGVMCDRPPRVGPVFVPSHPFPAESAARALAEMGGERVLVACPPLVSPGLTRLALAVGRLLADAWEAGWPGPVPAPVVVCPVRPRCAWQTGEIVLPHLVSVVTPQAAQLRVVWELKNRPRAECWLSSVVPADALPAAVAA
ncbi:MULTISPECIES: hypothetical protein [unclassified Pseudofrankia]|uniref:hypothetical protein n=1 Tax=unclassified Pseudofrankia TaxID=2994372 RepID=UPI0008D9BB59|nr:MULTISPECIES: hypothetical protein [unclassified Pseudofrankia]MDT3443604.1 hypothetical protein [Pseudofrankia sp. BMG5.37]OHV43939.1 hypothetical protein BCD48_26435 [Pseudofrankia sp. BMG5.36]